MSKDEFLKIQTCVLKVNIHCDGCKTKVKKTLQKIDGVYTIKIDSEQGKVTVSGNVDPATLIKKLIKNGKHAEIWGASKPHENQLNNQFKNLMIDNGKGGNNKGDIKKGVDDKPKGGVQDPLKLLQQLQQMKRFQDLKPLPLNKDHNQKSAGKLNLPEDEDLSDDEFDEDDDYDDEDDDYEYDEDDDEDEEFEDDHLEDAPLNKMKPVGGNGHGGSMMSNLLMNSQNLAKAAGVNNGGGNGKKGGGGENDGGANGGKKGGNQSQGGGKGGGGGAQPKDSKNGGGQNNKNDNHGGGGGGGGAANGKIFMPNGAMKSGGLMIDETRGMPNMMSMNLAPIGQMGNIPTRPMGSLPAVQGLPALNAPSGGGGGGYFPEQYMGGQHQQQLAAMMMNQRRGSTNENFQPMIYARPPPAVNYMPYPYPYPPPPGEHIDQYNMFSDENTSGCNIM
ncbi:heavy metal-associated isoprenylated plant protein 32-like [Henckelia pumila]|uniref:heavy metal-associated isoprenylated plant protein 32-like n=1 Tax=Henckelia pumila TaxID=405737 RepID=UPI003C6E216A